MVESQTFRLPRATSMCNGSSSEYELIFICCHINRSEFLLWQRVVLVIWHSSFISDFIQRIFHPSRIGGSSGLVDVRNGRVAVIHRAALIRDIGRIHELCMAEHICYNSPKNVNEIVSSNNYIYLLSISLG